MRFQLFSALLLAALYVLLLISTTPLNPCSVLADMPRYDIGLHPFMIHVQWPHANLTGMQAEVYTAYTRIYPNATMILWTDALLHSFIETYYAWFLPIYDAYPLNIQRVDASRYFILYHYGGLYADLDYMPLADFWPLLDPDRVSLAQSPIYFAESVQNSMMASPSMHSFWLSMFEALLKHAKDSDLTWSSGTKLLSSVAALNADQITILPCEVFMRLSPMRWTDNDVVTGAFYKYVLYFTPAMRPCGAFDLNDACMLAAHYGTNVYSTHRVS